MNTTRERALELVEEIDELARSDRSVQFGLIRHHYEQYAAIIAAALTKAEADGQHDERERWVKKFPHASPPLRGGAHDR